MGSMLSPGVMRKLMSEVMIVESLSVGPGSMNSGPMFWMNSASSRFFLARAAALRRRAWVVGALRLVGEWWDLGRVMPFGGEGRVGSEMKGIFGCLDE